MNRKRIITTGAIVVALLLVAGVAVAVFSSWKQTATSNFSAATVGTVDIGDAETVALFSATGIEPGFSSARCFTAYVRTYGTESWRIYSGGVGGTGLEDYLLVSIEASATSPTGTPGLVPCDGFTPLLHPVTDRVLSSYAAAVADYASGDDLGLLVAGADNYVTIRITMELPDTAEVRANATGGAQTSWVVENQ